MFVFSVNKDSGKKINTHEKIILAFLLAHLLTLIVKKLKTSVEQGRAVITLNIIKH
jgi:hypothetical protein